MTAPVETLFSLLTSKKKKTRQLGSNFCGQRLAVPNTLKAFKICYSVLSFKKETEANPKHLFSSLLRHSYLKGGSVNIQWKK